MHTNGTLYYILKDRLGSAYATTDASGNIVGEMRYYASGETRLSAGSMLTDRLFTGQRQIAGLGLSIRGALLLGRACLYPIEDDLYQILR